MVFSLFIFLVIPFIIDFDAFAKSFIFKNQNIVLSKDTPYGNLTITQTGEQFNFYENGVSIFSTDDLIATEEAVHYAMAQQENPQSVLVVSGDIAGMAPEISKYKVDKIDFVEVNPHLIEAMEKFTRLPQNVKIHVADARKFLVESQTKYDVVLFNLPPPSSLALNRFYTDEFFREVKSILNPGGVISLPLEGSSTYLSDEAMNLASIIYKTLHKSYGHVIIYPGEGNYFLASDDSLRFDISNTFNDRGIENEFVNQYYVNDASVRQRASVMSGSLNLSSPINSDFRPVAYLSQISYWLSWYGQSLWWVLAAVIFGMFLLFVLISPLNKSMLLTGFSASVTELVVLLVFQIFFGQLYQAIALLISGFMIGLAAGVWLAEKQSSKIKYSWLIKNQGVVGIFSLAIFLVLVLTREFTFPDFLIKTFLYISMPLFGMICGLQFSFVIKLQKSGKIKVASSSYAIDLIGAAGGAILAVSLLIPVLGIPFTILLLVGLNLFVVVLLWFKKRAL
jgi:spermidine synthase